MPFPNTRQRDSRERPPRPVCSEILIAGEWLAVCILEPCHTDRGTAHLPSPYIGFRS